MIKKILILLFLNYSLALSAIGNYTLDLSSLNVGSSSKDQLPHYIVANKWGVLDTDKLQSVSMVNFNYKVFITNILSLEYGSNTGVSFNENPDFFVNELFAEIDFYSFFLRVGKKYSSTEDYSGVLSSGSILVSKNASPIPEVRIGLLDYVNIPFTRDVLQIKGDLSHGWLQGDRSVSDVLIHEKSLYLKVNYFNNLKAYGGLVHEALWGGTADGKETMNVSFENYVNIFLNNSGGEDASLGDQINKLGNHLGIWDFGISGNFTNIDFNLYYQHYFEDGSGMRFQNRYDGLWGGTFSSKKLNYINNITVEYLTTKHQSGDTHNIGDEILGGRDSYYHHFMYKNGWSHLNNIIGNSFFSTTGNNESLRISNNRMNVLHLGVDGAISNKLSYKVLGAYGIYYPSYAGSILYPDETQIWHTYGEISFNDIYMNNLDLQLGFAYDFGDVDSVFGFLLGVNWEV